MVHGFEFTRVLGVYRAAYAQGDDEAKSRAVKWLRGEYRTKTEARTELGIGTIIDDDSWYDYVKLFARFLTGAGYRGMLVLIDELVNLYKIPNAITRQYNYEKILQMYNDTLQGKAQYLGIIMGGHADLHRGPQARRVLIRGAAQPPHSGAFRSRGDARHARPHHQAAAAHL